MNFSEALNHLLVGCKVRRHGWKQGVAIKLNFDRFGNKSFSAGEYMVSPAGFFPDSPWSPTVDDMFAEDWEVFVNRTEVAYNGNVNE